MSIFLDMPTQMPPLTPGTNKKLTEVLKASFASWEKEVQNCNITKGKLLRCYVYSIYLFPCPMLLSLINE